MFGQTEAGSEGLVADRCGGKVFVFVPNVCNAACDFCYVAPAFGRTGHLSPMTVTRLTALLRGLDSIGLREVRFTGGEPLIFPELQKVIEQTSDTAVRYTILTNGFELPNWADFFLSNPPSKITVSVHDVIDPQRIFGVGFDSVGVLGAIEKLVLGGVRIAATIVCTPTVLAHLQATLMSLTTLGVSEYKLVRPNSQACSIALSDFGEAARLAGNVLPDWASLRITDVNAGSCYLLKQAQLSVTLPSFEWFSCCATVGERPLGRSSALDESFYEVLNALGSELGNVRGLPCQNQGHCPIALTTLPVMGGPTSRL